MDRPLYKLYFAVACALVISVAFFPTIVTRTAEWARGAMIRLQLTVYQSNAEADAEIDARRTGKAIIVLDDGWDTQYTQGYALLEQYGLKACIAVVPASVGLPGYMDYAQLAKVYTHDWDLLNHTYNHLDLTSLPGAKRVEQINCARQWLNTHGFFRGSDIVVCPQGGVTGDMQRMIQAQGYAAVISQNSIWSTKAGGTLDDVEVVNVISTMPIHTVTQAIDRAMDNQSTVILVLHKIEPVTDDTQMQTDTAYFHAIVSYLVDHADTIRVVTLTEFLCWQNDSQIP